MVVAFGELVFVAVGQLHGGKPVVVSSAMKGSRVVMSIAMKAVGQLYGGKPVQALALTLTVQYPCIIPIYGHMIRSPSTIWRQAGRHLNQALALTLTLTLTLLELIHPHPNPNPNHGPYVTVTHDVACTIPIYGHI